MAETEGDKLSRLITQEKERAARFDRQQFINLSDNPREMLGLEPEPEFTREFPAFELSQPIPERFEPITPIVPITAFSEKPITQFQPTQSIGIQEQTPRNIDAIKEVVPAAPPDDIDNTPEWYEQPKIIAESAMDKVGEVISKTPILPKALEFIAPAFDFIHTQLEKPWASIITSPWSPTLPWRSGESWLDHEKREYAAWDAPTYVKGGAEFSMPLWWAPWLGWAIKGGRAIGVGNKAARATAESAKKVGEKLKIPTSEEFNSTLFKTDWGRRVALWAEDKPVLNSLVRAVGGDSAFVRDVGEVFPAMDLATKKLIAVNRAGTIIPVDDVVKRELVKMGVMRDMAQGYKGLLLPAIQKFGDI